LGVLLADSVPEWIRQFSWLWSFSRALRALPPWDFALIALSTAVVTGYGQRLLRYFLRRRNTLNLKKISLSELQTETEAMTGQQRRWKMLARGRLLGRLMMLATAVGTVLGVIVGLFLYDYLPSGIIISIILLAVILYLSVAVKKWLVVFDFNEAAHEKMRDELAAAGNAEAETEIHVHTERMLLLAKLPVQRFTIIWPLTVGAAFIESWMYVSAGVDTALNKLLLVLMALSIRSIFKLITVAEVVANMAARAIRPSGLDTDEEEA
jgi:MFS family permease